MNFGQKSYFLKLLGIYWFANFPPVNIFGDLTYPDSSSPDRSYLSQIVQELWTLMPANANANNYIQFIDALANSKTLIDRKN